MKTRRHHNNKGLRQIKRGATRKQVEEMAKRLKKYKPRPKYDDLLDRPEETPGYGHGV